MGDSNRNAFTEIEEAFFKAGELSNHREAQETFEDLDEGYQPKPLWRRLFSRKASES